MAQVREEARSELGVDSSSVNREFRSVSRAVACPMGRRVHRTPSAGERVRSAPEGRRRRYLPVVSRPSAGVEDVLGRLGFERRAKRFQFSGGLVGRKLCCGGGGVRPSLGPAGRPPGMTSLPDSWSPPCHARNWPLASALVARHLRKQQVSLESRNPPIIGTIRRDRDVACPAKGAYDYVRVWRAPGRLRPAASRFSPARPPATG